MIVTVYLWWLAADTFDQAEVDMYRNNGEGLIMVKTVDMPSFPSLGEVLTFQLSGTDEISARVDRRQWIDECPNSIAAFAELPLVEVHPSEFIEKLFAAGWKEWPGLRRDGK